MLCRSEIVVPQQCRENLLTAYFVSLLVRNFPDYHILRGSREPASHESRHDIRQAARPSLDPGRPFAFWGHLTRAFVFAKA